LTLSLIAKVAAPCIGLKEVMNHEENNLNPASLDDSKVDAHSASQIDALARRLSSESDNDFEVATESAEVAVSSGPTFACVPSLPP